MRRSEKMALRNNGTLLVTALLLIAAISRGQAENVNQLSGSDVTLSPIYRGDFKEITWLLNNNKLVDLELNDMKQPVWYKTFTQLKAGASLNNQTGELTIPRLTISDSGNYRAEVKLHDLTYHYTDITLTVKDPVVTPNITEPPSGTIGPTSVTIGPLRLSVWDIAEIIVWIIVVILIVVIIVGKIRWRYRYGGRSAGDIAGIIVWIIFAILIVLIIFEKIRERYHYGLPGWDIARIIGWIIVVILIVVIIFEKIRWRYRNGPLGRAINKWCPPFPYIPCCITALRVNQTPSPYRTWEGHACTRKPCCIDNERIGWIFRAELTKAKDLLIHCFECTHNPCCIRDGVIAWINHAEPNMA